LKDAAKLGAESLDPCEAGQLADDAAGVGRAQTVGFGYAQGSDQRR
jgi:hypothetical protein